MLLSVPITLMLLLLASPAAATNDVDALTEYYAQATRVCEAGTGLDRLRAKRTANRTAHDQAIDWLIDNLAQSEMADDHVARAVLSKPDQAQQFAALSSALEIQPGHPLAIAHAALLCGYPDQSHPFCQTNWAATFQAQEPTNFFPMLFSLSAANQQGNVAAARIILSDIADRAETAVASWDGPLVATVANAIVANGVSGFSDETQAVLAALQVRVGTFIPQMRDLFQICGEQAEATTEVLASCLQIGQMLVGSENLTALAIGAHTLGLVNEAAPDSATSDLIEAAEARAGRFVLNQHQVGLGNCLLGAELGDVKLLMEDLVEFGDLTALERASERAWLQLARSDVTREQLEADETFITEALKRTESIRRADPETNIEFSIEAPPRAERNRWWLWLAGVVGLLITWRLLLFSKHRR